jgi:hypothetical protein
MNETPASESAPGAPAAQEPSSAPAIQPKAKRPRWRSWLCGGLILLSGMILGSALCLVGMVKVVVFAARHPEQTQEKIVRQLTRRLDLSDGQAEAVKAALRPRLKAVVQIRHEALARAAVEVESMKEEVAVLLDEKQAHKWRERIARIQKRLPPPSEGRGESGF